MCSNEMSFYEAVKELYIDHTIAIRRRIWDTNIILFIVCDFDVKLRCKNVINGEERCLNRDDLSALDWEIKRDYAR